MQRGWSSFADTRQITFLNPKTAIELKLLP